MFDNYLKNSQFFINALYNDTKSTENARGKKRSTRNDSKRNER